MRSFGRGYYPPLLVVTPYPFFYREGQRFFEQAKYRFYLRVGPAVGLKIMSSMKKQSIVTRGDVFFLALEGASGWSEKKIRRLLPLGSMSVEGFDVMIPREEADRLLKIFARNNWGVVRRWLVEGAAHSFFSGQDYSTRKQ